MEAFSDLLPAALMLLAAAAGFLSIIVMARAPAEGSSDERFTHEIGAAVLVILAIGAGFAAGFGAVS